MPIATRLEDLLDLLHHPEERTRERAVRRVLRLGRLGFTPEQGLLVLKASSLPHPPLRRPQPASLPACAWSATATPTAAIRAAA